MSFNAIRWAWKQPAPSSSAKLLLLSLADRANEFNECYPSVKRLSKDTQLNPKTISKAIKQLIDHGLISDTGKRCGHTQSVRVLKLTGISVTEDEDPKTESHAQSYTNSRPNADPLQDHLSTPNTGIQNRSDQNQSDQPIRGVHSQGTRLANDFVVPDDWKLWAIKEHRASRVQVDHEAGKFVDHWLSVPGQKAFKADWQAAWRKWIRNAISYGHVAPAEWKKVKRLD